MFVKLIVNVVQTMNKMSNLSNPIVLISWGELKENGTYFLVDCPYINLFCFQKWGAYYRGGDLKGLGA